MKAVSDSYTMIGDLLKVPNGFAMKQVVVSNEAAEKLRAKFPWVYGNEILRLDKTIYGGNVVAARSPAGGFLGIGYINPRSKIALRILSFKDELIDRNFLMNRIVKADRARNSIKDHTNAYRVVNSEADDLPGLTVDSYDHHLAVQFNTLGMEIQRESVIEALRESLNPSGIYEKSDRLSRDKEGLTTDEGVLAGTIPEDILIRENEAAFRIRLRESQKTGFYLDQRRNRSVVASYVGAGFKVLDVFCNTGGFGIYAGLRGAGSIRMLDISQPALEDAAFNSELNRLSKVEQIKAEAFDYLTEAAERDRYDMIILDPPSFAKTKQARRGAIRGFKHLVSASLRMLAPGGYLAVFSCSHHISLDDLKDVLLETSINAGSRFRIHEHLFQDRDHPYLINFPQSLYLKGLLAQRLQD